jgi:hypothetical protein
MKIPAFIPVPAALASLPLFLCSAVAQQLLPAVTDEPAAAKTDTAQPVVRGSFTSILPDGRRLTIQRVDAPAPAPAAASAEPEAVQGPVVSEQARAARRAEWLAKVPLATYILPVTATVYPGGITHLAWRHQVPGGEWKEMEAWSRRDFSSLNVVSDIEVARIRYWIFATVVDGTLRMAGKREVPALEALPADGSFILMKGDVADAAALAPMQALHEHYRHNGAVLDAVWRARTGEALVEEERKRTAPPQDIVVRLWDAKPLRPAAARARRTEGGAQ